MVGGDVVAVTGAASGVGRAVVVDLLEKGNRVAAIDRDAGALSELTAVEGVDDDRLLRLPCDITDSADVTTAFARVDDVWARLDGLVNCAGVAVLNEAGVVEGVSDDAWALALAVNLTGTFWCCRSAIPLMARDRGGSVVNIASTAALVHEPGLEAYSAAKGGVVALTRALAPAAAARDVRVNTVCPGLLRTPMTSRVAAGLVAHLEAGTLLDVPGPEGVVGMITYLLGADARYVTGATLVVDGGFTAQ